MNEAVDIDLSSEAVIESLPAGQELDRIRTHVTETQFSDLEPLQANELLDSQHDSPPASISNESMLSQPTFEKPRPARSDMPSQLLARLSTQTPKYVGRVFVSDEQMPVFSFAQAPKTTVDYGRRMRPGHAHKSGDTGVLEKHSEALSKHLSVDRHTNVPQPKPPNESVASQQISSTEKELPTFEPDAKLADQQVSHIIVKDSKVQPEGSIIGSDHKGIVEDVVCLDLQRDEDRALNIIPFSQAPSSQKLPPKCVRAPNHEQGVFGQGPLVVRTEQQHAPATASPAVTSPYPVKPDVLKGTSDDRSKVVKIRRKPKNSRPMPSQDVPAQRPMSESMPTQEDLLQILLYRNQQEKKARDVAKAVQQAKDSEFQNMQQAYALLRSQMEDISKRDKVQQAELAKYEKVLPGLKIKARKLEDYLKGLTNDHQRLRDDAQSIQRQQHLLQTGKVDIMTDIGKARSIIELHTPGAAKIVSEARHHIRLTTQRHDAQVLRAQENADLLEAEQERGRSLEQEMSKISVNQQQMIELLHAQRSELMEKLTESIASGSAALISETTEDQACTRNMLVECINMLQEFKTMEYVEPDIIGRLDTSIKGHAENFNAALQQLAETSHSACSKQLKLNRHIQKQLDSLRISIKTEQDLSEQIFDLREIKATMEQRAQTCETSLAESRQIIIGHQGKEQYLITEISTLKAELHLLRAQPIENPAKIEYLCQIESRNSDLDARISDLEASNLDLESRNSDLESRYSDLETNLAKKQEELSQCEHQVHRLDEEVADKGKLIDGLTSRIDETKVTIRVLEQQKDGCEKQAKTKYESLRSQLLEAANVERTILNKENSSKVEKLRQQKTTADNKTAKVEEEVARLRAGMEIESKRSGELQAELGSLNLQIQSRNRELHEAEEKSRTAEENLLSQVQQHKEEKLSLERHISETDTLLVTSVSEFQAKNEKHLQRINAACQAYNNQAEAQIDIDCGIDIIIGMLTQSKAPPRTPVLNNGVLQESAQQPGSPNDVWKRNVAMCEEELDLDDFSNNESTLTVQRHRAGPSNTRASHQSQTEVVVEESQIEETTIRRNLVTTKFREDLEGNKRPSIQTPTRRPDKRLISPLVASIDRTHGHSILSSSRWNSAEPPPATPILITKGPINRNQLAWKSGRKHMPRNDKAIAGPEAQSIGTSYVAKTHLPSIPSRRGKRSAADFGMTPRMAPSKRRISEIETAGLGPIIPDSQSPSKVQANNRTRKIRCQTDKYAARFEGVRPKP
ncbi:hypothetical protein MMC11_007797 [Xylographa trunciseda]|nr:hypothetical protein [Xylographa trunciseda]